jgi:hypothetical protein
VSLNRRRWLACGLAAAIAGSTQAATLPEGRGGTVEVPDAAAIADPWLQPASPRLLFAQELEAAGRDLAQADGALLLATTDSVLIMDSSTPVPRIIGRITLPESVLAIEAEGETAWLLTRSHLYTLDIRDPAHALLRGSLALTAPARIFTAAAGRGYVLSSRGLHVLELSGSGPAAVVAEHAFDFEPAAIATDGRAAYLAAGERGLLVIDADGRVEGFAGTGPVLDVFVEDGRIYLAQGEHGLTVIGRDDEEELRWLGSLRGTDAVDGVRVAGTRAAIRDGAALYLLDVENPLAIERSALLWRGDCCSTWLAQDDRILAVAGNRLIGIEPRDLPRSGNEGLAFGQGVNFGGQRRIFLDGDIAYVADWFAGLHIYELSDPRRPALLASLHSAGSPKGVVVRDGIAFVADDDHGLLVVDVVDPRKPRALGRLPLPGLAYTPVLDGDLLYLASHHGGVLVIDVANPRNPSLLTHFDTPGKAWSLRVRDGIAWVADDDAGLAILDVSDPRAPREIARYRPGGRVEEVLLDGDIAYLALYDDGVHVLDIADPASPRLLARAQTPGNARGLALRGTLLHVADWMAGVQIFDVSDPARPWHLGSRDTDGAAWGLALQDDALVVADWWGGLLLLDTEMSAQTLAVYPRRESIRSIAIRDSFAFVSQGDGGMQVFDIRNPLNPIWVTGVDLADADAITLEADRAWVLHSGGTRIAAVDITDPFQAHAEEDYETTVRASLLRTLDGAILLAGDEGYALIDTQSRVMTHVPAPLSDAASAGIALIADVDGNIRELDADGQAGRVLASFDSSIVRLLASDDRVIAYTEDERLRVFTRQTNGTLRKLTDIPVPGGIDALAVDGPRIHLARGRTVRTLELGTDGWRLVAGQETMAPVTHLAIGEEAIYLAGTDVLRALSRLPETRTEKTDAGGLLLHIPPGLPPGEYDILPGQPLDATAVIDDAVHIEPLRFGRGPRNQ